MATEDTSEDRTPLDDLMSYFATHTKRFNYCHRLYTGQSIGRSFADNRLWDGGRVIDITGGTVQCRGGQDEVASRLLLRRCFSRYVSGATDKSSPSPGRGKRAGLYLRAWCDGPVVALAPTGRGLG